MKPSRLLRALARSHRWLGLGAALFVLWLAATGALVNHADDLGLARATVSSPWLLDTYGIGSPPVTAAYRIGNRWLAQAERSLYMDADFVSMLAEDERLVGALAAGEFLAVATNTRLRLVDRDAAPVETLGPAEGLPEGLQALGATPDGRLVLRAAAGLFVADPADLAWRRRAVPAHWSVAEPLPPVVQAAIERDARTRVLTREQLVRDLHSGRFFGLWAKWVADVLALVLIALSVSGVWLWWRARREFPKRAGASSHGSPRA